MNLKKLFHFIFATAELRVQQYLKLILYCQKKDYFVLALIVTRRLQKKYGVFISHHTSFDETLFLCHPTAIVIGEGAKIGSNVKIYQNVTLGRANVETAEYPIIGNNTVIYCGSVILGGITVGENCIIGANSVVTTNIPNNCVALGVPAKFYPRKEIVSES